MDKAAVGTAVGDTASMVAADRPSTVANRLADWVASRAAGSRHLNCWDHR